MIPRILMCTENGRANAVTAALRRRGAMVSMARLSDVQFDSTAPGGMVFPRLRNRLPDGVLVRSVAAGSFEAITRRLGVLHALGRLGVPVWNSAQSIEKCVDKSMTTFLLAQAGLPTPDTFVVEGIDAARTLVQREIDKGPLVLKPLFGAQGRGIRLIETLDDLPPSEGVQAVYYLQRYVERIGPPFRDIRVLVCAGKIIAMMRRRSDGWVSNVTQGGVPEELTVDESPEAAALGLAAAAAVSADFAGVDLMETPSGGLTVIEVNSMPAWAGLQSVTSVDINDSVADAFLQHVQQHHESRAAPPLRFVAPANS